MDKKALYQLSYGVFMLATNAEGKKNGCITNTCMQVANSPTRVAISVLNTNYTCDLIKKSGVFTLSMLDQTVTFETIKHFGFQSGRDVDKFEGMKLPADENDVPYMGWQTCAMISGKVVSSQDLGSHTLFIAQVTEARTQNDLPSATYAYYFAHIKPKPQPQAPAPENKQLHHWVCRICGYVYEGETLPPDYVCPICKHPAADFDQID